MLDAPFSIPVTHLQNLGRSIFNSCYTFTKFWTLHFQFLLHIYKILDAPFSTPVAHLQIRHSDGINITSFAIKFSSCIQLSSAVFINLAFSTTPIQKHFIGNIFTYSAKMHLTADQLRRLQRTRQERNQTEPGNAA